MKIKLLTTVALSIIGLSTYGQSKVEVKYLGEINNESNNINWGIKISNIHKNTIAISHSDPDSALIEDIKKEKFSLMQKTIINQRNNDETGYMNPIIGNTFEGNWSDYLTPTDNSIAISNAGQIVSVVNDGIDYYYQDGTFYQHYDWSNFFSGWGLPSFYFDPRVMYDVSADRFILVVLNKDKTTQSQSSVLICFSSTNNPNTSSWYVYIATGNPLNDNSWFDYPQIGISQDELFITGNLFFSSGSYNQSIIYQCNKNLGYNNASSTTFSNGFGGWSPLNNSPFNAVSLMPATYGYGSMPTGMYFVSNRAAGDSQIRLYHITGNLASFPTLIYNTVSTAPYAVPSPAMQLGSSDPLDISNCRILSAFYLNGIIHFVFHSDFGSGWSGINYNRLDVNTLTNQSSMFGNQGVYSFAYPSVVPYSINGTDKTVVICFLISSPSIYPHVDALICDDNMNFTQPTIIKQGETYVDMMVGGEKWGDYSGVAKRFNSASGRVWVSGSYGSNTPNLNNCYKTWIAEIIGNTTGIDSISFLKIKPIVYPNPTTDFLSMKFISKDNESINISIIDEQGKMAKELFSGKINSGEHELTFNKLALNSGNYFLSIKGNNAIISNEKFIVVK